MPKKKRPIRKTKANTKSRSTKTKRRSNLLFTKSANSPSGGGGPKGGGSVSTKGGSLGVGSKKSTAGTGTTLKKL